MDTTPPDLILQAQSVNHTLVLVEAEEAWAWQRCNDLRARLAEDVRTNTPAYHEAMAYHRHTGGALQVLRRLQQQLVLFGGAPEVAQAAADRLGGDPV